MQMIRTLFLYLCLVSLLACNNSDREKAQEQFRERQRTIQERAGNTPPATPEQQQPQPAPQPVPDANKPKPASTAGDKVVAIKDGDTIELLRNGETIKVRLYGVDAPEKNQAFGQRSKQFTSDLAFGKFVRLIEHNKDRYGRTVGTIILPDGRSLNEEIIKEGFAWHYKDYSKDVKLANLETDARRFKRGLWSDPKAVAPWDFRKNERELAALKKEKKEAATQNAPLPAGATTRKVYLCNSSGSAVYHFTQNCSVLKRCKTNMLTVTQAQAIREHGRRPDKTCSPN